jgi:hypothetical protein
MTSDGLRLLQDLRRSLLEPPPSSGHAWSPRPGPTINPKPSVPSPNLIMKPGTTPADLHRNPDATPYSHHDSWRGVNWHRPNGVKQIILGVRPNGRS